MYSIKEIYFTQQGEGYHTGRDAMFLRFTGCNLWTGYDKDKETAICNWCDTNFVGNDGPNGGKYTSKKIVKILHHLWPKKLKDPFLVCTGGEPLLQINHTLITAIHQAGFKIAIETNGTRLPPDGVDWICVSPKAKADFILKKGDELKIVYPQDGLNPLQYKNLDFDHFFIQPMDGPNHQNNINVAKRFVANNPKWKLSLQTQKILGIP